MDKRQDGQRRGVKASGHEGTGVTITNKKNTVLGVILQHNVQQRTKQHSSLDPNKNQSNQTKSTHNYMKR